MKTFPTWNRIKNTLEFYYMQYFYKHKIIKKEGGVLKIIIVIEDELTNLINWIVLSYKMEI